MTFDKILTLTIVAGLMAASFCAGTSFGIGMTFGPTPSNHEHGYSCRNLTDYAFTEGFLGGFEAGKENRHELP